MWNILSDGNLNVDFNFFPSKMASKSNTHFLGCLWTDLAEIWFTFVLMTKNLMQILKASEGNLNQKVQVCIFFKLLKF